MACSDIPAGDAKLANMITNATNSSLSHALPLESAEQTQSSVASGRTPPSDDEQIVTTTNSSLTHAPQFGYADQSQSRLMNIPRELRDMIYGYVFDYNIGARKTAIKPKGKEADPDDRSYYLPSRIQLEETAPPSKEAILPCRGLHLEMRKTQISGNRHYWTNNRFSFPLGDAAINRWLDTVHTWRSSSAMSDALRIESMSALPENTHVYCMSPSTQDMQHIRHFSASWNGRDVFDVVFELGKWHARALPPLGTPPGPEDDGYGDWWDFQHRVKSEVEWCFVLSKRPEKKDYDVFDPRTGEGLDGGVITTIARRRYSASIDGGERQW
jgi:hypothetical protein